MKTTMQEIDFKVKGRLGIITLQRPTALNACSIRMVQALTQQLLQWQEDPQVHAVIIHSSHPRAFCAGGDVREIYWARQQQLYSPEEFFRQEYQLNLFIHRYPKPYIALMQGITMGGGVGISLYGQWRIATPSLIFAMPETGLGFFPDVGSSYFLSRLPGEIGTWLGLTGQRLNAWETHQLGWVDLIIPEELINTIITTLSEWPEILSSQLTDFFERQTPVSTTHPPTILNQQPWIDRCFSASTVEEIWQRLEKAATPAAQTALAAMSQAAPTSLKVTLEALRRGKSLNLADCLAMEYHLARQFMQQPDFFEGVRARLIDKDQQPRWQPATLEKVNREMVSNYFEV